jgi:hypothetical protein
MLLTADAGQARRELQGVGADLRQFGAKARQAGTTASAGLKQAETQVIALRRSTAGVTGTLVAQFNDVGQMLVAGQSPLLLAAQQGTQISQALGPLGARGAVAALGQAFLGMLNPVNLAVFAVVAGLGLLGNALRDLVGETQSFEGALGDLEAATRDWQSAARVGFADLKREFGQVTPELVELQRQITQLALVEMLVKSTNAAAALNGEFDSLFRTRSGKIADLLKVPQSVPGFDPEFGAIRTENPIVTQVRDQLGTLTGSADVDKQLEAVRAIREIVASTVDLRQAENQEQRDFVQSLLATERQLQTIKSAQAGIGSAQQVAADKAGQLLVALREEATIRDLIRAHGEDSAQVAVARVEAERRSFEAQLDSLDVSAQMKGELRAAWDAANGARASLSDLASGLLSAAGASDETRRAIEDAWAAITGAADATNVWAGLMSGVAAEVRGIGAALAGLGAAGIANAGKQIELEALRAGKSVAEARRAAVEAEIRREGDARVAAARTVGEAIVRSSEMETKLLGVELDRQLDAERQAASERERIASRSATGGSAAARQTEGAQRLIGSLRAEMELLRATDPVQQEMLRNREALAGATAAERAEVEALIAAKQREELAQKQAADAWDFAKTSAFETLDALIVQGESASEVFANLAKQIASALLQSALLGNGPLAGLFGGAGGGLFGLFKPRDLFANIGGFATGGMVHGPGGPRDDAILARLSAGEYVVNAAATARHRPLLEAINGAPRFAAGGIVGGGSLGASAGINGPVPITIDLRLSDDLDARIAETSETVALRVTRAGVEQYDRKVLPKRVQAIQADPRRVA